MDYPLVGQFGARGLGDSGSRGQMLLRESGKEDILKRGRLTFEQEVISQRCSGWTKIDQ